MEKALTLAEKGRVTAPPNPWVGSVIIKDNICIGEGYHVKPGTPHAEKVALATAGEKALGATLYSTLEPCSHTGRTPPCTDAIIKAGIKTVVIGTLDPDPQVSGTGIKQLKEAGIEVITGILEDKIKKSLTPYLHHRKTKRPYVTVKMATSIDGKIAHPNGRSQWITCKKAREDVHHLRHTSCGVLVGSGTALKDNPRLTPRIPNVQKMPTRIVLDTGGKVTSGHLFDTQIAPTIIATTENRFKQEGLKVLIVPQENRLESLLDQLGELGFLQVFCEGGATLISHLYNRNLINELIHYQGPHLFGEEGTPLFHDIIPTSLDQPYKLHLESCAKMGACIKSVWKFKN